MCGFNQRMIYTIVLALLIFSGWVTFNLYAQSNYTEYAPWVKSKHIAEHNNYSQHCRWPHTPGNTLYITFKWGSGVSAGSAWRTAFEQALLQWNSQTIKPFFTQSNSGLVELSTYSLQDGNWGTATPDCPGATTLGYKVKGNVFYEPYTTNLRQYIATHELGHSMSIAHIPGCDSITIMSYCNPDRNIYYEPQADDVEFINQFYP
jgi:hypothetical protein